MMSEENVRMYKIDFTEAGWAYNAPDVKEKVHAVRGYYGFPFFSCVIAICNALGDTQQAIRVLLKAFGPTRGATYDMVGPLYEMHD